jgi:co-chaperonin GroES (HSP10)
MTGAADVKFRPLRGLMLVRREAPEAERGGIIVPETWRQYGWRATVLRCGPKAEGYEPGDEILFLKDKTVLPFRDRSLAVTDSKSVIAKLVLHGCVECIIPRNEYVMVHLRPAKDSDGVALIERHNEPVTDGIVYRIAQDCLDVRQFARVWYPPKNAIKCCESGESYTLIKERDILACENPRENA